MMQIRIRTEAHARIKDKTKDIVIFYIKEHLFVQQSIDNDIPRKVNY